MLGIVNVLQVLGASLPECRPVYDPTFAMEEYDTGNVVS